MHCYDERGARLDLTGDGHHGGEGAVYRIAGDGHRVAKIYHAARLGSGVQEKLRVMLERPPEDPDWIASRHRSIAWVDGLIYADQAKRDFRGFTMPYVDTTQFRQAHAYYDATDRLRTFGGAFTWRHLLFAAHNLASSVSAVHAAGHRVGDLRETNLLVAPSSLVTLIDCDSFQIRDPRTNAVYPTRVATGDYLPPELQGIDFRIEQPDRYHGDLFALAVLVFRFLMLGVHPFQARGRAVTDTPTTEAKIRKGTFAFSGRQRGVEPPAYAPPYDVVPAPLKRLFARAFIDGHSDPAARPEAAEWVSALAAEGERVKACAKNANHWYCGRSCPWCTASTDPFPGPAALSCQIPLKDAPSEVPESARIEQVRAYARVALADGSVTDRELAYLRKAGGELGLRTAVVDRTIDDESRRLSPVRPTATNGSHTNGVGVWARARSAVSAPRALRERRTRSAVKAAVPVLLMCALVGALAPIVGPAVIAVAGLPLLAVAGELGTDRRWRTRMKLPLLFARRLHDALGHAAPVLFPWAILGIAAAYAPLVPHDLIARIAGAGAGVTLALYAITRLPHTKDASAASLRSGRDLVWRSLVGDTGRTRRATYLLWLACASAALLVVANRVLWWPLPGLPG